jgi:hypothetical protein
VTIKTSKKGKPAETRHLMQGVNARAPASAGFSALSLPCPVRYCPGSATTFAAGVQQSFHLNIVLFCAVLCCVMLC